MTTASVIRLARWVFPDPQSPRNPVTVAIAILRRAREYCGAGPPSGAAQRPQPSVVAAQQPRIDLRDPVEAGVARLALAHRLRVVVCDLLVIRRGGLNQLPLVEAVRRFNPPAVLRVNSE